MDAAGFFVALISTCLKVASWFAVACALGCLIAGSTYFLWLAGWAVRDLCHAIWTWDEWE